MINLLNMEDEFGFIPKKNIRAAQTWSVLTLGSQFALSTGFDRSALSRQSTLSSHSASDPSFRFSPFLSLVVAICKKVQFLLAYSFLIPLLVMPFLASCWFYSLYLLKFLDGLLQIFNFGILVLILRWPISSFSWVYYCLDEFFLNTLSVLYSSSVWYEYIWMVLLMLHV